MKKQWSSATIRFWLFFSPRASLSAQQSLPRIRTGWCTVVVHAREIKSHDIRGRTVERSYGNTLEALVQPRGKKTRVVWRGISRKQLTVRSNIQLEFVSLLKVCKISHMYKVFNYWCRVKEVKRDVKSVRLGIVFNRTIIIIIIKKVLIIVATLDLLKTLCVIFFNLKLSIIMTVHYTVHYILWWHIFISIFLRTIYIIYVIIIWSLKSFKITSSI